MTVTDLITARKETRLAAELPHPRTPVEIVRDTEPVAQANVRVASQPKRGTGYARYRYSVGGTVSIISDVELPELDFFRVPAVSGDVDIEIRRGHVGMRKPRWRTHITEFRTPAAFRYEEHLGALGANFSLDMGEDRIRVTVSSLLARSPHVLYTNVIEALLRFVFVSRGKMLLHSACMELGGVGLMLSAKTDTGKTGTVLRLLREQGGQFLSDDMTIIDENAAAHCYPKPLTISAHTLRAVDPGDMRATEWGVLNLKGRLHSKGGRSVGLEIGNRNLPVMTANALVQMLVSPPKYPVDRLVPTTVKDSVTVSELFIIERGTSSLSDVSADVAIGELIDNTDDAYGFPPFRYFAPALVIGGEEYEELRAHEAEILSRALGKIRTRRLASDSFGWADEIPALISAREEPDTDVWPQGREAQRTSSGA